MTEKYGEEDTTYKITIRINGQDAFVKVHKNAEKASKSTDKATDSYKKWARAFRKTGSYVAITDVAMGGLLFKMSRVAMTIGPFGVGLALASGGMELMRRSAERMRDEFTKHISPIGAIHDELEKIRDFQATEGEFMAQHGFSFDEKYLNYLESIDQLYPEYLAYMKVAKEDAADYVQLLINMAGGHEKVAAAIKKETEALAFEKAFSSAWDISIGKLLAGAYDTIMGFLTGLDKFDTAESYSERNFDPKIKALEKRIAELKHRRDTDPFFVEAASGLATYEKELEFYKELRDAFLSGDLFKLDEVLGRYDGFNIEKLQYEVAARTLVGKQQSLDRAGMKTGEETMKDVERYKKRNPETTKKESPEGVWGTTTMGPIPYQERSVPLYTLYGGDGRPGHNSGNGDTTTNNSPTTNNIYITNNNNINNDADMDTFGEKIAGQIVAAISGSGSGSAL